MIETSNYSSLISKQREFFVSGVTFPISFRIAQLKKLKSWIETHESDITTALKNDLGKSEEEAIITEILLVTKEINFFIKHLKKLARPKKVSTPIFLWPGRSTIYYEPYGVVLIISPWNYPFLLMMTPLIGSLAAGNCAILKPSEVATQTEQIIVQLTKELFSEEYVKTVTGGPTTVSALLEEKFDYIFFTGSQAVGKIVMTAAAKHLTPVTLELGGKSPCIVDETANLDFAARRIAWGKMTNAGQTCIAPDYLYVHQSCKEIFTQKLHAAFQHFYKQNQNAHIINQKHFHRLQKLMQRGNILFGGEINADKLFISPTLIDQVTWQDPIMQEEIFGPLLPVLTYDHLDEVIQAVKSTPKPLALYLFTHNKEHQQQILNQLSFGGGCINDCLVHLTNSNLPFGGVQQSGIGQYHGQYSFETFSHRKSIYHKHFLLETKLEYPPHRKKLWWIRQLFKL